MSTPSQIENQRQQANTVRQNNLNSIQNVDSTNISNATPSSLQAQGISQMSNLVITLGQKVYTLLIPLATNLFNKLPKDGCPNNDDIQTFISSRNSLISQLNSIGSQLSNYTQILTGTTLALSTTETVLDSVEIAKTAVTVAASAIPSPPGMPGALLSTLSGLDDVIQGILFSPTGAPQLPPISSALNSAALAVSLINNYIQQVVNIINSIDAKIKECSPNQATSLSPISSNVLSLSQLQTNASQTSNGTTYKGFIISIVTVPYNSTINRIQAVAKNQNGIVMISTPLSFTTNSQVLIDELKLNIDNNNLVAY